MSASTAMTSTNELIASRLFGNEQSNLIAWMEQTKTRIEAGFDKTVSETLPLSSHNNFSHDNTTMMQLCERVEHAGFACYEFTDKPADVNETVSRLLSALSLRNSDKGVIREVGELSLLQDLTGSSKGRFPPYQSKAMNWHTDGYYNDADESVRSFILHCVSPAAVGGGLLIMDDAYLVFALWQEDPQLVLLLSHPEAMTLPRNKDQDGHDRPDRSVPVILRNADESISMRFTTRTQHINWRCSTTQDAAQRASELIKMNPQWHTHIMLKENQGIVTRNVLHAREKFVDAPDKPKRQILRGRFNSVPTIATLSDSTDIATNNDHVTPK